ncbi:MAG: hypothetical protein P0S96_03965 [Simkaniaceae bacterium]|nr:hypothetical protein [Candidatus Sacchlamyda saccharinae]
MASAAASAAGAAAPGACDLLPQDAWAHCLSHLVPSPEIFRDRTVCQAFEKLTLPAIQLHLRAQEAITSDTILQLHLPLYYLLIYQNGAFDQEKEQQDHIPGPELRNLWRDYSVPEIFSYALGFCTEATEIDLTGSRYSVHTFIGEPNDFVSEVATLDYDPSLVCQTDSQIDTVVTNVPGIFHIAHPHPLRLPNVETLKINAPHSQDVWPRLAQIFPNLKILEVDGIRCYEHRDHFIKLEDAEKSEDRLS